MDDSISPGRLRFLRAGIHDERLNPTSDELKESYLTLPWRPVITSGASPNLKTNSSRKINYETFDRYLFGEPWLAVCVAQPPEGHILHQLFHKISYALLSPPFPLPCLTVRRRSCETKPEITYLITVLPKTLAALLVDSSVEASTTQLDEETAVSFNDLVSRQVTDAEFALALPSDFQSMPVPLACRTLSHLLASMMLPKRSRVPIPRVLPTRQRARLGWIDGKKEPLFYNEGGGVATIAISPTGVARMWAALPRDTKYHNIDPVCRIIDMMSAMRIDPEPSNNAHDWLIYQARWGYYFPGYRSGILTGFELLMGFGAVISGLFFTEHPSKLTEISVDDRNLRETRSTIGPEHAALVDYLADQRSWMAAYEMAPLAPQSGPLAKLLHGLVPRGAR